MRGWEICKKIIQRNADAPFLVNNKNQLITYQKLYELVEDVSLMLTEKISQGPIAWVGTNNILFYTFVLACIKINYPIFIFYNSWSTNEIKQNMAKCNLNNLVIDLSGDIYLDVADDEFREINTFSIRGEVGKWILQCLIKKNTYSNESSYENEIYLATSGTTDNNKWVGHTCEFVINNLYKLGTCLEIKASDRIHSILPLYTSNGITITFFLPFCMGISIYQDYRFNLFTLKDLFSRGTLHGATILSLVPSVIGMVNGIRWTEYMKVTSMKKYRFCICGTAPLYDEEQKKFEANIGIPIYTNYGLTEVLFVSSQNSKYHKGGSVGQILQNVDIKCEEGEIHIKNRNGNTLNINNNGSEYFATGDIGYLEKNELYIIGRKKQIIIRGGYNINTNEIEKYILSFHYVKEVVCFGIEDVICGELLVAAVVFKKNQNFIEELYEELYSKFPKYMVPKIFDIAELPRNDIGKPNYQILKKRYLEK